MKIIDKKVDVQILHEFQIWTKITYKIWWAKHENTCMYIR